MIARTRGFTLIELLIVIAILAMLAAILIPNFLHARAQAQTAACEANLTGLAQALEEYAVDNNGTYPSTFAALVAANGGVYLKAVPPDPAGGVPYALVIPATAPCPNSGKAGTGSGGEGDDVIGSRDDEGGNGPTAGAPASYLITDGGNHDVTTTTRLPGKPGTKNIVYCSGFGILGN